MISIIGLVKKYHKEQIHGVHTGINRTASPQTSNDGYYCYVYLMNLKSVFHTVAYISSATPKRMMMIHKVVDASDICNFRLLG